MKNILRALAFFESGMVGSIRKTLHFYLAMAIKNIHRRFHGLYKNQSV